MWYLPQVLWQFRLLWNRLENYLALVQLVHICFAASMPQLSTNTMLHSNRLLPLCCSVCSCIEVSQYCYRSILEMRQMLALGALSCSGMVLILFCPRVLL